ncbi:hypothetical protein L916_04482 [Phytophthora nicotianae]|uniref:Polycystin cation channel PKD1/PKD2 domain-containing protein n=1 Tax=Phytophthora nicotianae TaxID=4792 RepID=W2JG91_PHYNI|nr:hypothetical protein L916_04482 [Phytophthora nicotianae]
MLQITLTTIIHFIAIYIVMGYTLYNLENVRAQTEINTEKKTGNTLAQIPTRQFLYILSGLCAKFGALAAFPGLWTATITRDFDDVLLKLANTTGNTLQEKYQDVDAVVRELNKVAALTNALNIVGAIAIFQLGLFTIRQLSFHPQLNVLARTVVNSLRQFRDFVFVFLIIFITFTSMGNVLFGGQVHEFSTAALSREACMDMLFGTFNFNTIVTIRGSSLFYWGYMTIVSLILLNMMLAIVMGTYKAMSKDGYQGEINVLLATRISYIYRYPWQFLIKHLKAFSKYVVRQMGCGKDGHSMEMESSKLSHSDVIVNGKFRPPVLLMVLKKKLKDDGAYFDDDADPDAFARLLSLLCSLRQGND